MNDKLEKKILQEMTVNNVQVIWYKCDRASYI